MPGVHAKDKAAALVADAVVSICTANIALYACLMLPGKVSRTCSAREPSIKLLKPLGWCPLSCLQPANSSRNYAKGAGEADIHPPPGWSKMQDLQVPGRRDSVRR